MSYNRNTNNVKGRDMIPPLFVIGCVVVSESYSISGTRAKISRDSPFTLSPKLELQRNVTKFDYFYMGYGYQTQFLMLAR